ncbi:MAG: DUF1194 domain-containing protein [Kiloniellaceae bacterium]
MRRRTIAVLCLAFLPAWAPAARAGEAVDLELVLAADGSGSIDEDELRVQREGYAQAITSATVLNAIRSGPHGAIALAYIEWGAPDSQHTVVDWTVIRDAASAKAFADELLAMPRLARGYNSISGAIDYAAAKIRTNAYEGARKIIDVSGDGPQIGGRPVQAARDEAVIAGITINALVVKRPGGGYPGPGGMPLLEHYERDVIGGFGAFVMTAGDRASFADAIRNKMVEELAGGRVAPEHPSIR